MLDRIRDIHRTSRGTYGAPRVHAELVAQGHAVGRKRIARLMRRAGLRGISRRKGTRTTVRDARTRAAPDLVERDFTADAPDRLWVADITYIPTWAGFLHLAVVLDAFSRRVVGWSMANHLRTQLVLDALDMALWQRRPDGVIHHSDQGSQYTSLAFGKRCRDADVRPSTGSVGDCYDNAMCESLFGPSNASCSSAGGSGLMPKHGWPSSSSSRAGTKRRHSARISVTRQLRKEPLPPARPNPNCPRNRIGGCANADPTMVAIKIAPIAVRGRRC